MSSPSEPKGRYFRATTVISASVFVGAGLAWSFGAGPAMRAIGGASAREFFKASFARVGYIQVSSSALALLSSAGLYYVDRTPANAAAALLALFPFPWTFAVIAPVNHALLDSPTMFDGEVLDLVGLWEKFNLPRVVALGAAALILGVNL
ncbi:hypothetical protein DFJ74DRAFT_673610 [Hyaloraphidium curvatum]|nr:hypothetical protein DFJ74DRAFT_673610 [Hyaloraphidium curvatum]